MKTNKQGVRDLGHAPKTIPVPDFGKNQMPPELASKLLEEQASKVAEYGPPLSAETNEFLVLLGEECAETIKRSTKVQRFGLRKNPWDGQDNVDRLEAEIGDILAVLDVLTILGVISQARVQKHQDAKLAAFVTEEDPKRPRLRHATPALRELIRKYAAALDEP